MAGPTDAAATTPAPAAGRRPVVEVVDVHVEYKVLATGKRATAADSGRKLLQRSRGTRTVHALKGVSFTAYENDSIGVIGSNGSGKSPSCAPSWG